VLFNAKLLLETCTNYLVERYQYFAKSPEYLNLDIDFRKQALYQYQLKTCWLYKEPQRAPWVEKYLDMPHSNGLRSGQKVSDDLVRALGYNPKMKWKKKETTKE